MKRIVRGALLGFVMIALVTPAPRVDAAEQTITPNPTGYYTRTRDPLITLGSAAGQVLCTLPSAEACLNPAAITGGTPEYFRKDNYLYVANIGVNEDANGAVAVPLFSIPFGSTVTSLRLDFMVENEPSVGTFAFVPSDPNLMFCLVTTGWAGQDSAPWESRPDTDCSTQSEPKLLKEETRTETNEAGVEAPVRLALYSVDLMPMARKWAEGAENHGVLIRPTPDAPPVFEAAVRGPGVAADAMAIHVTYEEPEAPAVPVPAAPAEQMPTGNAPSFSDADAGSAPDPEPQINVPDDTSAVDAPLEASQPVASTSTPWWTYLGLPLGGAILFALGRGSAAPIRAAGEGHAGPVSRLMDR